jgi:hypothetical protein
MKKINQMFLIIKFLTFLSASQAATQVITLDTPDDIIIEDNILNFGEIGHAYRYRIEVEHISDGFE